MRIYYRMTLILTVSCKSILHLVIRLKMNFRILDQDELNGRGCVEGYLQNDQLPPESSSKVTRATFRLEVTVSLEKIESSFGESFDEPIFVSPFIGTPEKHCHRRQCYCIDDCMVTSELTISVYPGIIIR